MEQTLKKIAFGAAVLAAMSLSACGNGGYSKLEPRAGYTLAFAPSNIAAEQVECARLDSQLVSSVPGCKDYGPIIDQQVYDSSKIDTLEVWMSRVPVACGWIREESMTVDAFPDCYVWVQLAVADDKAVIAAQPEPEPPIEQSTDNSAGNTNVDSSRTSGPEGDSTSASSRSNSVKTDATSSTLPDGTGTFSLDNGHTTMTGTFAEDGSVASVSFGESDGGVTSQ